MDKASQLPTVESLMATKQRYRDLLKDEYETNNIAFRDYISSCARAKCILIDINAIDVQIQGIVNG
jgi:hypothetical protein